MMPHPERAAAEALGSADGRRFFVAMRQALAAERASRQISAS
jgi:phosphoribosylformylglycinamidine (FGAM) synthase-like amidotransferase family enzyme